MKMKKTNNVSTQEVPAPKSIKEQVKIVFEQKPVGQVKDVPKQDIKPKEEPVDIKKELAKILVPNRTQKDCKSLVELKGSTNHFIIIGTLPANMEKAWEVYRKYDKKEDKVKFMELVYDITHIQNRELFEKVSIVRLN